MEDVFVDYELEFESVVSMVESSEEVDESVRTHAPTFSTAVALCGRLQL